LNSTYEQLRETILHDMEQAHPDIRECVKHLDIMRMGHAMIRPTPGAVFDPQRRMLANGTARLLFANSDISGISIFEEAQNRGSVRRRKSSMRSDITDSHQAFDCSYNCATQMRRKIKSAALVLLILVISTALAAQVKIVKHILSFEIVPDHPGPPAWKLEYGIDYSALGSQGNDKFFLLTRKMATYGSRIGHGCG